MKLPVCIFFLAIPVLCTLSGCNMNAAEVKPPFHFSLVPESKTSIGFNNMLTESDSVNFLTDQYIYIGSGVGTADFNNDGLTDIFFAGGQVSSKLYVNKGNFEFEDVTAKAGVQTTVWCTGVSIVDINNDGLPDVYVCVSHARNGASRKNLLFINKGNLQFSEQAAAYGLADSSFSTQAAFFDYDKDGDLDMYLVNHNVFQNQPNNIVAQQAGGNSTAADKLYRNEGIMPGTGHPVYKDVSAEAGIKEDGYGLGIAVSDLNQDGWPDVYVANDFISNDLLWLNNKDGTFTNCIARSIRHQSYNSMGVDAADINNDQLPDIAVLDMLPETNYRKKTMFAGSNPERYDMEQRMGGYQPEFTRNMLQLDNGTRAYNNTAEPFYSEIGQLAGISETDWSWSILMADFDNDGWKDVHITNGIAKDLTNNDFLLYRDKPADGSFSGVSSGNRTAAENSSASLRKELDAYGAVKVNNYLYRNNGNLTFSNVTGQAGLGVPSVSHGAAYADLDNDGDLDLVINNMNQEAFIWKNEIRKTGRDSTHNFIALRLKGSGMNTAGIGAKVLVYTGGKTQFQEQCPVRGYLSSVDNRLYFGVGDAPEIDSVKICWPDDKVQVLRHVRSNQMITADYGNAGGPLQQNNRYDTAYFTEETNRLNTNFKHSESFFFDFAYQRVLPQRYSQLGPALATGDVNGDGLTDFFAGGASRQPGKIFIQHKDGSFSSGNLVAGEKTSEDISAVLFDADGDKDLDLLVTEGSLEFGVNAAYNQPRLYLNDGHGNFTFDRDAIPSAVATIAQAVAVGDYDGDGDMDIFIGGRILPNQYPLPPACYLLQNNHGRFTDVTRQVCPSLQFPGMLTAAVWTDFNNDKKMDLVICGEWMPVRFFQNTGKELKEITAATGMKNMAGLWRSLQAADIDNDGDMDLVAGNMGINNKYHISAEHPSKLYAGDIDNNGSIDLIPAYYAKNSRGKYDLFPGIDRTQLAEEVPVIKRKYLLNRDFAKTTLAELIRETGMQKLVELTCETDSSVWIENLGNGKFKFHPLPIEAQFAPVNAIIAKDMDGDGNMDLLVAGNEYQAEISTGRYDASYGLLLTGNGKGSFTPVPAAKSGLTVEGDVKGMQVVRGYKGSQFVVAAINNDSLRYFKINGIHHK